MPGLNEHGRGIWSSCTRRLTLDSFVKPFDSIDDVSMAVGEAVLIPLGFSAATHVLGFISAQAGSILILSLAAGGVFSLLEGSSESRQMALITAGVSFVVALTAPLLAAITSILVPIVCCLEILRLVTRTAATICDAMSSFGAELLQNMHNPEQNNLNM